VRAHLDRLSIRRCGDSYRRAVHGARQVADTPSMSRSPVIRRYALVPATAGEGAGFKRWRLRPYAACATTDLMSSANASTSSGVVSQEHIQRTSPVDSSQT